MTRAIIDSEAMEVFPVTVDDDSHWVEAIKTVARDNGVPEDAIDYSPANSPQETRLKILSQLIMQVSDRPLVGYLLKYFQVTNTYLQATSAYDRQKRLLEQAGAAMQAAANDVDAAAANVMSQMQRPVVAIDQ